MKKNHLFSIITAGMLTITLLAGCGNTGSNAKFRKRGTDMDQQRKCRPRK